MGIYFQKHNFKPKEKLTAQMLNELESFIFELLLSKTYSLTDPVEITENTEPCGTPANNTFLNAALSFNNVVGISFDGTPYICPIVELPGIGFAMGNIKALFELLALEDADAAEQLKSALDQNLAYLVDRENNIPVLLLWDSEGSSLQVYKAEDNQISMSPFGTHSLNILLADLTHSDMKALPDIKISNNGDIGFDKNESYPIQGLTMEVWFELMRYAEIIVKADRQYCLMSYHDALGMAGIEGVYEGFLVTPIGDKTSYVFVVPDGANITDLPNELIYKGTYT